LHLSNAASNLCLQSSAQSATTAAAGARLLFAVRERAMAIPQASKNTTSKTGNRGRRKNFMWGLLFLVECATQNEPVSAYLAVITIELIQNGGHPGAASVRKHVPSSALSFYFIPRVNLFARGRLEIICFTLETTAQTRYNGGHLSSPL
jgi:hypothetical protein